MNLDRLGETLVDTTLTLSEDQLQGIETALASTSGAATARLVPFFGPTAAGQDSVIGPLGMDLERTLQGGQSYEWHRAFEPGEQVHVTVIVEDVIDKENIQLATVLSEYRGSHGDLIQRQRTVFVERKTAGITGEEPK